MTQQPQRQVLALHRWRLSCRLRDTVRPVRGHLHAGRAVVQFAQAVRSEDEECAPGAPRGKPSVHDVRLGGDIGRCSVPREEGLPGRRIGHAGIEVVEYTTGKDIRLFERRIANACRRGKNCQSGRDVKRNGDGGAGYCLGEKTYSGRELACRARGRTARTLTRLGDRGAHVRFQRGWCRCATHSTPRVARGAHLRPT